MTEFDTLLADPAEETQDETSETPVETAGTAESPTPLFSAPVLDRIRTSD